MAKLEEVTRVIWRRSKSFVKWNSGLDWIKSGTQSKVYDMPYEIYTKYYGPTVISDTPEVSDILLQLRSDIQRIVSAKRFQSDDLIRLQFTGVADKSLITRGRARKSFWSKGRKWHRHTGNWRIQDVDSLISKGIDELMSVLDMPSKPAWLAIAQVTIYLEDGANIKTRGKAIVV